MVTAVVSQECELWSGKRLCEGNWWLMVWPYHSLQFNHSSVVSLSHCISCRTQPSAGRAEATRSPEWRGRRGGGVGRRESNDTEDEICDMTKEYANKWKETVKLWYTIWVNTRYSFFFFLFCPFFWRASNLLTHFRALLQRARRAGDLGAWSWNRSRSLAADDDVAPDWGPPRKCHHNHSLHYVFGISYLVLCSRWSNCFWLVALNYTCLDSILSAKTIMQSSSGFWPRPSPH